VYRITALVFLKCKIIAIVLEVFKILVRVLHKGQCGTGCCVWVEIHSVVVKANVPSVPNVHLMYVFFIFLF